jgi:hypothetical protein
MALKSPSSTTRTVLRFSGLLHPRCLFLQLHAGAAGRSGPLQLPLRLVRACHGQGYKRPRRGGPAPVWRSDRGRGRTREQRTTRSRTVVNSRDSPRCHCEPRPQPRRGNLTPCGFECSGNKPNVPRLLRRLRAPRNDSARRAIYFPAPSFRQRDPKGDAVRQDLDRCRRDRLELILEMAHLDLHDWGRGCSLSCPHPLADRGHRRPAAE